MARFTRIDVIIKMKEAGIIPYFYIRIRRYAECDKSLPDGGIKVFEFTNRGDFAHELFSELNKWAEKEIPGYGYGCRIDC